MSTKRLRSDPALVVPRDAVTPDQDSHAGIESMQSAAVGGTAISEENIRVAAYFLAEQRGFGPGCELDDWLAAERSMHTACEVSTTALQDIGGTKI